jgi:hypothetical protein
VVVAVLALLPSAALRVSCSPAKQGLASQESNPTETSPCFAGEQPYGDQSEGRRGAYNRARQERVARSAAKREAQSAKRKARSAKREARSQGSINKKEILVIPGTKFKLPNKHSFSSLNP